MEKGIYKKADGVIYTEKNQPANIKYLKVRTYASPNKYTLYGDTKDNNFECNAGKDCIITLQINI